VQRDEDVLEHRIRVDDIIAVKKNNERELLDRKLRAKRDSEQKQRQITS